MWPNPLFRTVYLLYGRELSEGKAKEYVGEDEMCSLFLESWPFHRQHLVSGGSYLRNYVEYMFGTERGQSAKAFCVEGTVPSGIEFMELRKAEAYLSQIIQGVWLKLVVEHCRRLQPYNMGLL